MHCTCITHAWMLFCIRKDDGMYMMRVTRSFRRFVLYCGTCRVEEKGLWLREAHPSSRRGAAAAWVLDTLFFLVVISQQSVIIPPTTILTRYPRCMKHVPFRGRRHKTKPSISKTYSLDYSLYPWISLVGCPTKDILDSARRIA